MESKRRGLFTKSKLVKPLYNRGTKLSGTAVRPHSGNNIQKIVIVNQEQLVYPHPKVAYVVPDRAGRLENFQGLAAAEDDHAVDSKAARYISSVQERFRLEEMQLV